MKQLLLSIVAMLGVATVAMAEEAETEPTGTLLDFSYLSVNFFGHYDTASYPDSKTLCTSAKITYDNGEIVYTIGESGTDNIELSTEAFSALTEEQMKSIVLTMEITTPTEVSGWGNAQFGGNYKYQEPDENESTWISAETVTTTSEVTTYTFTHDDIWALFFPEEPEPEPVPEGAAYEGTVTLEGNNNWWVEYVFETVDALFGDVDTEEATYIVFTSTSSFQVGYSSLGSESGWEQPSSVNNSITIMVDDINFESIWGDESDGQFKIGVSLYTGSEQIFNWSVYTTPLAIKEVKSSVEAVEVARYNLLGQKLSGEQKGINIIVYSDGSSKKVLVK